MAHTDSPGYSDILLNYAGPLFTIGNQFQQTPLLTMTGGLTGGRKVATNTFPMGNFITLDAAASNTVDEQSAITAPASDVYTPAQTKNFIEIHQRAVELTYAKMSNDATISGEPVVNMGTAVTTFPSQRDAHLAQLAVDLEWSMFLGAGTDPTASSVNGKTTGLYTAVAAGSQTKVNAGGAALSPAYIKALEVAILGGNGRPQKPVFFGGAVQIQALNTIYGYAPADWSIGGITLKTVNLPVIGTCGIAHTPILTSSVLMLIDISKVAPVFQIVPGKPAVFFEPLAQTGASVKEQLYCQFGVDYTHVNWHGAIYDLATS